MGDYFFNEIEKQDVKKAVAMGTRWGYGNLIDRLKVAWAKSLLENYKDFKVKSAVLAAGLDVSRFYDYSREDALKSMREYIGDDDD